MDDCLHSFPGLKPTSTMPLSHWPRTIPPSPVIFPRRVVWRKSWLKKCCAWSRMRRVNGGDLPLGLFTLGHASPHPRTELVWGTQTGRANGGVEVQGAGQGVLSRANRNRWWGWGLGWLRIDDVHSELTASLSISKWRCLYIDWLDLWLHAPHGYGSNYPPPRWDGYLVQWQTWWVYISLVPWRKSWWPTWWPARLQLFLGNSATEPAGTTWTE